MHMIIIISLNIIIRRDLDSFQGKMEYQTNLLLNISVKKKTIKWRK